MKSKEADHKELSNSPSHSILTKVLRGAEKGEGGLGWWSALSQEGDKQVRVSESQDP